MVFSSLRRKGLAEVKRVWRYSLELEQEEFDIMDCFVA